MGPAGVRSAPAGALALPTRPFPGCHRAGSRGLSWGVDSITVGRGRCGAGDRSGGYGYQTPPAALPQMQATVAVAALATPYQIVTQRAWEGV